MKRIIVLTSLFSFFLLTSCTYSITQVHTEGIADDVVDEEQTNTPNISPVINVPVSSVPKV